MMENVNLIDLTNFLEALIAVLVAIAMRYLIPWIKAKLNNEQEAGLAAVFDILVMAAEKIYGAKQGDAKLEYVQRQLAARGIQVDTMRLKAYVNAAIKKMEQGENGGLTIIEHINGVVELEEDVSAEEDEEPQTEGTPEGV